MKVRICPLCDQPMKKAHHCDTCDSFVWKPLYLDIHYNTDQMQGPDCSYHQQEHTCDYEKDGSVKSVPVKSRAKTKNIRTKDVHETSSYEGESQKVQDKAESDTGRHIMSNFVIIIILALLYLFSDVVSAFFRGL